MGRVDGRLGFRECAVLERLWLAGMRGILWQSSARIGNKVKFKN